MSPSRRSRTLNLLTSYDDDDSKALVAQVIARNPDRKIQAAAYKGQIAQREMDCPVRRNRSRTPSGSSRSRSRKARISSRSGSPRPRRRRSSSRG